MFSMKLTVIISDGKEELAMKNDKETPAQRRERMRQEELKNPSSSMKGSNLADVTGGMGWKGAGLLILLIIIGFVIIRVFFN